MSGHYTDSRRWSYVSKAWIFASSWDDKEEIAMLRARVAELDTDLLEAAQLAYNVLFLLSDEVKALGHRAENVQVKLAAAINKTLGEAQ